MRGAVVKFDFAGRQSSFEGLRRRGLERKVGLPSIAAERSVHQPGGLIVPVDRCVQ
jgi:hypothetical protein